MVYRNPNRNSLIFVVDEFVEEMNVLNVRTAAHEYRPLLGQSMQHDRKR